MVVDESMICFLCNKMTEPKDINKVMKNGKCCCRNCYIILCEELSGWMDMSPFMRRILYIKACIRAKILHKGI